MFDVQDIEKVPIERLLANLTKRHRDNTNDIVTIYHLARVHSMAYATAPSKLDADKRNGTPSYGHQGDDSGVPKEVIKKVTEKGKLKAQEHLTNAILFYRRGIEVYKSDKILMQGGAHQWWNIMPLQLGYAWCLDQAGRRAEALEEYRNALKISWAKEIKGEVNFESWRENKLEDPKPLPGQDDFPEVRGSIGPGVGYSSEIIKYMKRLLDPAKDKAELEKLTGIERDLRFAARSFTPILLPLVGNLALGELVNPKAKVMFDLDGSGIQKKWGWITTNAAWLVYDKEQAGRITSGLQMMGNVTFWVFWENGYQPLAALDDNGDGMVSGAELKGFALWQDLNRNGISESGEVLPVQAFGIQSISSRYEIHPSGIPWSPQGITLTNGNVLPSYDWIVPGKP